MNNCFSTKMVRDIAKFHFAMSGITLLSAMLGSSVISINSAQAAVFGTNLIINGDAEAGSGSASGFEVVSIPDWTTTSNFTVVLYDAVGGFPLTTSPGPTDRGDNFFAGGPSNGFSTASQVIDVSSGSGVIDQGDAEFDLSGFLGGFDGQGDNMTLQAFFRNASDAILGNAIIGPVTVGERNSITGLLERSTSGQVPLGTRNILVQLTATRLAGDYNDGYADNLSLVLTDTSTPPVGVPEPSSVLGLLGVGALMISSFRKGQ
jgi:hypothetical protein